MLWFGSAHESAQSDVGEMGNQNVRYRDLR